MWTYRVSDGRLTHDGALVGECYSGHGEGLNNPNMEHVHDVGPIPKGSYLMGPFFDDPPVFGEPGKGPLCSFLTPDAGNEMFGREGFMIHGDNAQLNHTASDGCIVASHSIRAFIAASSDRLLEVI